MKWILFALQILPAILEAIKAVEAAIPVAKAGGAKKALVMTTLAGSGVSNAEANLIGTLVDASVDSMNVAGVFKRSVQ